MDRISKNIPVGFQIFEDRLSVAGTSFREKDAAAFAKTRTGWLEFERDTDNKHDRNAIRVIGCTRDFSGTKRRFVGYVPKEISKQIVVSRFWGKIQPRLRRTNVSSDGYIDIEFQILGPQGQKNNYAWFAGY